jgi:CRISPR-associated endonuclease/helicase Cas3
MQALHVEDAAALRRWIAFWLALHDIGKFSEAFQGQKPDLFRTLRGRTPRQDKVYAVSHDSLGMLFWNECLSRLLVDEGWLGNHTSTCLEGLDCWMRAVTGHHGQPPKVSATGFWSAHFDRNEDQASIFAFSAAVRSLFLDDASARIPFVRNAEFFNKASRELSWWIAGLTVLADWIGSNTVFFRYRADYGTPAALPEYWKDAVLWATSALDVCGVLPVPIEKTHGFADFFPHITTPSPLQAWAEIVDVASTPQIYLLEDVTGAGKTEAAVALAHRLMKAECADGFYIALPTMATANAMYGRVARVYQALFSQHASLVLASGQRDMVQSFSRSIIPPGPSDSDNDQMDESATARCAAWLADHNKRALLAPAGVGTIDQALLAVLHSKHQSLRLLGLFCKVLIVDEVHACDSYMQHVLETLLEFHARAGGSAILLSATLPQRMKQSLLDAFARGLCSTAPAATEMSYPLATCWGSAMPNSLVEKELGTRGNVSRVVSIRYVCNELEVMAGIESALASGRCVCWIRNTVADAVAAFDRFKSRLPPEKLTLVHARFALKDRLDIEARVLRAFGRDSDPRDRAGQLVIGTQVLEQSIDVDFDLMVTDLAPIDRIIQRAGRLQRHARNQQGQLLSDQNARDERGEPCLWVFGPDWTDQPESTWFKAVFPKASKVYAHHGQLWLTANALRKGHVVMPDDARDLIEYVFDANAMLPEDLQRTALEAEGREHADASVALQNTLKLACGYERGGVDWWSEARTPTRLGEASVSVLLARWDTGRLRTWIDGEHGMEYSSVRVAERLIARRAEDPDPQRESTIVRFLQSLPNRARWSVLLPLEMLQGVWTGTALAPGANKDQFINKRWVYAANSGLVERPQPQ